MKKKQVTKQSATLTGPLPFRMTSDILFKILMQTSYSVLKGIVCSFSYLCRCFDNLQSGQGYLSVKSAVHIGFLDYTLFPEHPEFFSTYRLINQRTGQLYSSKFQISEVDLTLRNQATEEDIAQHRDLWAAFFKATEWGELMALANKDSNINEAVVTLKKLTEDELFKMRYQAREDQLRQQWDMEYYYNTKFAEMEEQMSDMAEQNIIKDERIAELEAQLKELQSK